MRLTEHGKKLPREVMVSPPLAHGGGTVTYWGILMASIEGNLLTTQLQSWKKSSEPPQDLVPTNSGVFLWEPRGPRAGWNPGFYTSFWPLWLLSISQIFILHAKADCHPRPLHLSPKPPWPVSWNSNPMLYISVLISVEEGEQFHYCWIWACKNAGTLTIW